MSGKIVNAAAMPVVTTTQALTGAGTPGISDGGARR